MAEWESWGVDDTSAKPIPVSRAKLAAKVAKRKGFEAVAVCDWCRVGLIIVKLPGPWVHQSTGSVQCPRSLRRKYPHQWNWGFGPGAGGKELTRFGLYTVEVGEDVAIDLHGGARLYGRLVEHWKVEVVIQLEDGTTRTLGVDRASTKDGTLELIRPVISEDLLKQVTESARQVMAKWKVFTVASVSTLLPDVPYRLAYVAIEELTQRGIVEEHSWQIHPYAQYFLKEV